MNIFDDILRNIERQPLILHRAAVKADARRFSGEAVTAFSALDAQLDALDRRDETGDREANAVEQAREDEARDERFGSW